MTSLNSLLFVSIKFIANVLAQTTQTVETLSTNGADLSNEEIKFKYALNSLPAAVNIACSGTLIEINVLVLEQTLPTVATIAPLILDKQDFAKSSKRAFVRTL
jgi:hypothetical protein